MGVNGIKRFLSFRKAKTSPCFQRRMEPASRISNKSNKIVAIQDVSDILSHSGLKKDPANRLRGLAFNERHPLKFERCSNSEIAYAVSKFRH